MTLVGGTVADVYTGTWIRANVEIAATMMPNRGRRRMVEFPEEICEEQADLS